MRQGRSTAEVARIDAALAARGIKASWLHRILWRRGVSLPPAALMLLPQFVVWQVFANGWMIVLALVAGLMSDRSAVYGNVILGWIFLTGLAALGLWLLWQAITRFKRGGIAWIERLALAALTLAFFGALAIARLMQGLHRVSDATDSNPSLGWAFWSVFFVGTVLQRLGKWQRDDDTDRPWSAIWGDSRIAEVF
jgi:hypothetical protein